MHFVLYGWLCEDVLGFGLLVHVGIFERNHGQNIRAEVFLLMLVVGSTGLRSVVVL